MGFNISKNQILELLKNTMIFNMSYDGQSWIRSINYDLPKIINSDIGKQVFHGEVGQLGMLTYFSQNWGISDADIKGIANELMMKSKYLGRITFEDNSSREKYLSELIRLDEMKPEANQSTNIPSKSTVIDGLIKQVNASSRATIKGRPTCDVFGDIVLLKYDNFRLVENDIAQTMARMKKAKESGVAFASILDYRITSTNEKGKSTGYVMQERAPGVAVFDYTNENSLQDYRSAIALFSNMPQVHFDKLVKDFVELMKHGLSIDTGNSANFFYDKEKGFTFIDLQSFKGENILENDYSRQILSQNICSIFFDSYYSTKTPDNEVEQVTGNTQNLLVKLKAALEKVGVSEQEFRYGAAETNDKFIRAVFTRQRQPQQFVQNQRPIQQSNSQPQFQIPKPIRSTNLPPKPAIPPSTDSDPLDVDFSEEQLLIQFQKLYKEHIIPTGLFKRLKGSQQIMTAKRVLREAFNKRVKSTKNLNVSYNAFMSDFMDIVKNIDKLIEQQRIITENQNAQVQQSQSNQKELERLKKMKQQIMDNRTMENEELEEDAGMSM